MMQRQSCSQFVLLRPYYLIISSQYLGHIIPVNLFLQTCPLNICVVRETQKFSYVARVNAITLPLTYTYQNKGFSASLTSLVRLVYNSITTLSCYCIGYRAISTPPLLFNSSKYFTMPVPAASLFSQLQCFWSHHFYRKEAEIR